MTTAELIALAERTVAQTRERLPAAIQEAAASLPVVYHDWPSDDILGEEFEPNILGMFVGQPHGSGVDDTTSLSGHIMLFVENIWDAAEGDPALFAEEVRITYLHELGHFLGLDEDDLEQRGLE